MKLYRKRLTSIEELKREKIRLRYERRSTKAKHLLPDITKAKKKLMGGKKGAAGSSSHLLQTAMSLMGGKFTASTVMSLAGPLLKMVLKRRGNAPAQYAVSAGPAKPSMISRIVKDAIVCFLLGKAIQLSAGLAKSYLKARKDKKKVQQVRAQLQRTAAAVAS